MPPGRPNAHPGRTTSPTPNPFAPPYPEKSVTFPRHPFPALPHPTPRTPHLFPTPAQFLPTNPPQFRNFANPLETPAHPCYPRPSEGPTPRPGETLPPTRGKAPSIRKGVPCGRPVAVQIRLSEPCSVPLSSSATRRHSCVPANRRRHYRLARDRRHPQLGGAQNVAETNRIRFPACAGITVLGTPGNLTQARRRRSS